MSAAFSSLRQDLGRDVRELDLLIHRLRQLLGRLPSLARDEDEDLPEEETDEVTELRGTLQCVLADHLEPAARALAAAAAEPSGAAGDLN